MHFQTILRGKSALAIRTCMRFLASVHTIMCVQAGFIAECFVANIANVITYNLFMLGNMSVEAFLARKLDATYMAFEW